MQESLNHRFTDIIRDTQTQWAHLIYNNNDFQVFLRILPEWGFSDRTRSLAGFMDMIIQINKDTVKPINGR